MMKENQCMLCPRECGADRRTGRGICQEDWTVRIARAALHMWEEPCISGKEGSGAVFFAGCSLGCVFCQNQEISRGQKGKAVTIERLAEIFLELQAQKANNINLVTAGHYVPQAVLALQLARKQGLTIPVVYNTSSYEKAETLKLLEGLVDVYLPDFKYMDPVLAKRYSRAEDYPQIVMAALREMVRQVGEPEFDDRGIMKRGVIVRHLILPGHTKDSKQVLRYLHETYGDQIYISIMNQFTPPAELQETLPELARKVTKREYDRVLSYAIELGIENGFWQEGKTAKESFIPEFDESGV